MSNDKSNIFLKKSENIKDIHPQAILIFMTNHNSYIFETQIYNPFYFIRKSHFKNDLRIAMEIFQDNIDNYLTVTFNREEITIKMSEIMYIEIYRGKITFHTSEKDIYYWGTFNELQKNLPSNYFIRIHQSYIINRSFIKNVCKNEIIIDKKRLPISRKYRNSIYETLRKSTL